MNNRTLVISHGHAHRKISEINYDNTVFQDPDPEADADYEYLGQVPGKFDSVICASTPTAIVLSNVIFNDDHDNIDGTLDHRWLSIVKSKMKTSGRLWIQSQFITDEGILNKQLLIDKMYVLGFVYIGSDSLTFESKNKNSKLKFLIFKLTDVQLTKDILYQYLLNIIQLRSELDIGFNVKYAFATYFDDNVGIMITKRSTPKHIDNILNNIDEELIQPSKLISLKYIMNDDTEVKLV